MELKLILPKQKNHVVKYLMRKEAWKYGFLRYNLFKKMIKHIIKINNNYEIRRLFLYLVEEDIFIKKKLMLDHICICLKTLIHQEL